MLWLLLVFGLIIAIFLFITLKPFRYWSSKGVKQSSIFQLWVDNIKIIFQLVSPAEHTVELNKRFSSERYFATCYNLSPILMIQGPELVKQITVKDFGHFVDRRCS
uniref:Cytochrome P450 n=1 Tax=Photinus pyralis TaxID=7054 RepID=A0A1Y1MMX3_PHOPY